MNGQRATLHHRTVSESYHLSGRGSIHPFHKTIGMLHAGRLAEVGLDGTGTEGSNCNAMFPAFVAIACEKLATYALEAK